MTDTLLCGIDIGSSKISTVVAMQSKEDEELRIIGFNTTPSKGVRKGLIVDIEKVTVVVEESVEKAERMAGHKIKNAFVSVGGPHIVSLNSHGIVAVSSPQTEISQDDVDRVIEAARAISLSNTRQIIEVSPRDYIVNGQEGIKNPVGMTGVRLEVETHIITASQTNLKNIERCLTDLDIQNLGYVFSGLASADAVVTNTERELGIMLVDMGGGKTDICMYVEDALAYSSSIPVGARHITNDIAVGLKVSLDTAEKIKLHLSKTLSARNEAIRRKVYDSKIADLNVGECVDDTSVKTLIDGIIVPRLEEIFKFISDEIEKSGFIEYIPSGLVITGGGALTVGALETGKRIVGLPIRIGVPQGVSGLVDEILDPQYATTIGLILYGRNNIMAEEGWKNFNKVIKDFSLTNSVSKFKSFVKQFIP